MANRKTFISTIMVLAAGIGWGTIGVSVRALQACGITSGQISALRCVFAAAGLAIYFLLFSRKSFVIKPKDIIYFIGMGIGSILFFNFCYFVAINLTSLSVAAILLYTAPAIVVVFSAILFKEKITKQKILAIVLCFVGCAMVCIQGGTVTLSAFGILAGLGSGFGYAMYSIIGTVAIKKYSAITVTAYTFFVAAIASVPFAKPVFVAKAIIQNPDLWVNVLWLGVVSTLVPYLLYTFALKNLKAGDAAIIASIEPIAATLTGLIVFSERVNIQALVGICLVVLGVVLTSRTDKKKE